MAAAFTIPVINSRRVSNGNKIFREFFKGDLEKCSFNHVLSLW